MIFGNHFHNQEDCTIILMGQSSELESDDYWYWIDHEGNYMVDWENNYMVFWNG